MSCKVKGKSISLTRGDTCAINVEIHKTNGELYIPNEGDTIRFALKEDVEESTPLILKDIPTDTMMLKIDPEDTKPLAFGVYVYDIELTTESGEVYTFITRSRFKITEEVH